MYAYLRSYSWLLLLLLVAGMLVIRYIQRQPRFVQGEQAQDLTLVLSEGDTFRLADFRGHYVLLHFWGSWCGPCRKENPAWAALYDAYGDRDLDMGIRFHILSVGIETLEAPWQKAIRHDKLAWPLHYAEFDRFSGELALAWGVREIPANYLINPHGIIIGVNMKPEEVGKVLSFERKE
jgi:thiol-disulfide isomerase/thioredoxin